MKRKQTSRNVIPTRSHVSTDISSFPDSFMMSMRELLSMFNRELSKGGSPPGALFVGSFGPDSKGEDGKLRVSLGAVSSESRMTGLDSGGNKLGAKEAEGSMTRAVLPEGGLSAGVITVGGTPTTAADCGSKQQGSGVMLEGDEKGMKPLEGL